MWRESNCSYSTSLKPLTRTSQPLPRGAHCLQGIWIARDNELQQLPSELMRLVVGLSEILGFSTDFQWAFETTHFSALCWYSQLWLSWSTSLSTVPPGLPLTIITVIKTVLQRFQWFVSPPSSCGEFEFFPLVLEMTHIYNKTSWE